MTYINYVLGTLCLQWRLLECDDQNDNSIFLYTELINVIHVYALTNANNVIKMSTNETLISEEL